MKSYCVVVYFSWSFRAQWILHKHWALVQVTDLLCSLLSASPTSDVLGLSWRAGRQAGWFPLQCEKCHVRRKEWLQQEHKPSP